MKKRTAGLVFTIAVFAILLLPFAGMAWNSTQDNELGTELAPFPQLTAETGKPNVDFLNQLGTWFGDHFAYRTEFIDADAAVRSLAGASTSNQVIRGTDGWLYYSGELNDYLGRNVISDRGAYDIAHNLRLVQDIAEGRGQAFFFTIAPDKSSAAGANMPSYYLKGQQKNAEKLVPALKSAGVNYIDVAGAVTQTEGDSLWLKRDSHWNNRGALRASQTLAKKLHKDASLFNESNATQTTGEIGDLESLAAPGSTAREPNLDFGQYDLFRYTSTKDLNDQGELSDADNDGEGDNEKSAHDLITTESDLGKGSLYLFRDSFGNALLPFMASEYQQATFSKLTPYDLSACANADTVGIEIAERHLTDIANTPPSVAAPASSRLSLTDSTLIPGDLPDANMEEKTSSSTSIEATMDGSFLKISGTVDPSLMSSDSEIEVAVRSVGKNRWQLLHPFYTIRQDSSGRIESENGYSLYTDASPASNGRVEVKVFAQTKGVWHEAAHQKVTIQ